MNRRDALRHSVFAAGALTAWAAQAQDNCAVLTPAAQSAVTPDQAIERLKQGNERFTSGRTINCDLMQQVKSTSGHQSPVAAIVGCIDSRVPPELVFDQRIGDIFAARIAGNFVNDDIIGSMEFATELAGAKAIVVLGHTECGAIKGAVDNAKLGQLTGLLAKIRPSLDKLDYKEVPSSKNKALVQRVAEQNVQDATALLLARSTVLTDRVKAGKLRIVGAIHDIGTGKITWL